MKFYWIKWGLFPNLLTAKVSRELIFRWKHWSYLQFIRFFGFIYESNSKNTGFENKIAHGTISCHQINQHVNITLSLSLSLSLSPHHIIAHISFFYNILDYVPLTLFRSVFADSFQSGFLSSSLRLCANVHVLCLNLTCFFSMRHASRIVCMHTRCVCHGTIAAVFFCWVTDDKKVFCSFVNVVRVCLWGFCSRSLSQWSMSLFIHIRKCTCGWKLIYLDDDERLASTVLLKICFFHLFSFFFFKFLKFHEI